jgi:xylulokinase
VDQNGRVHAFCHAVPGAWHAMGVMLSAAGSLRWLRDVAAPGVAYDALTAAAGAWPPGTEGLVFLTALRALRSV